MIIFLLTLIVFFSYIIYRKKSKTRGVEVKREVAPNKQDIDLLLLNEVIEKERKLEEKEAKIKRVILNEKGQYMYSFIPAYVNYIEISSFNDYENYYPELMRSIDILKQEYNKLPIDEYTEIAMYNVEFYNNRYENCSTFPSKGVKMMLNPQHSRIDNRNLISQLIKDFEIENDNILLKYKQKAAYQKRLEYFIDKTSELLLKDYIIDQSEFTQEMKRLRDNYKQRLDNINEWKK